MSSKVITRRRACALLALKILSKALTFFKGFVGSIALILSSYTLIISFFFCSSNNCKKLCWTSKYLLKSLNIWVISSFFISIRSCMSSFDKFSTKWLECPSLWHFSQIDTVGRQSTHFRVICSSECFGQFPCSLTDWKRNQTSKENKLQGLRVRTNSLKFLFLCTYF